MTVFISLGKLGPQWKQYHHTINRYLIYAGIMAASILLLVYAYQRNKIRYTALLTSSIQKDRMLKLMCFAFVILGGEAQDEGLRMLFNRVGPAAINHGFPYTFPSEQSLISLTVCDFAAYLLVRNIGNLKVRISVTFYVILLCL
ncbi:hypothetical protein A8709_26475 [Paenibacillus pectinilyticus]|uniref:Uncharacterized protein n=1 Tax=Paenibacillus pectinilyticus TaxID=512399 RepID=A0A1C1A1G0_9BACL|nr:hypothetical protein [Paenibacillus pectinilyticus]OCT14366.1 hypothetical protein A8709_26475 [Paenibacillus pectinilyticus]